MADKQFFSAATETQAVIEAAARFGLSPHELAYRTRSGQLRPGRVVIEVDPAAPRREPAAVEAGGPRPERLARPARQPATAHAGPGPGPEQRVVPPRRERQEPGATAGQWLTSEGEIPVARDERASAAAVALVRLSGLEVTARLEAAPEEGGLRVDLTGPARTELIAGGGELLHACEYVLRRMVRSLPDEGLTVDAGGYRAERERQLRAEAARAAANVRESGEAYLFAPLPPAERRVVHLQIQEEPGVASASEGDGDLRRVRVVRS
jgi:spoIIIJ-associated protein